MIKTLIWIKVIVIYFLIMVDKIFTIPFSGIETYNITELVKKDYKLKKVLKRVIRYTIIYSLTTLIYMIL